jgi:tight adherence protein C
MMAGAAVAGAFVVAAGRCRPHPNRAAPARAGAAGSSPGARYDRRLLVAGVAITVAAAVASVGPGIAIIGGGVAFGIVTSRRRSAERTRRDALTGAMPDAIELLVMCIHAGLTPTQAVAELARLAPQPVRPGFQATERRLHRGAGFADALTELTGHCGPSALALVSVLGTAVRDGLPLAPVLDRLTDEANAGRRRAGEAAARRLPVRLSFPLVACTLPSFVLLAIAPAVLGALSTVRGSAP